MGRRMLIGAFVAAGMTVAAITLCRWQMTHVAMGIVPPWYALPFYGIVRAIPGKTIGTIAGLSAIYGFFLVSWALASGVRVRKPWPWVIGLALFLAALIVLAISGGNISDAPVLTSISAPDVLGASLNSWTWLGRVGVIVYFISLVCLGGALVRSATDQP
jgi:quinol-cytochrome oxidoreductase complex cytochrome b subunit